MQSSENHFYEVKVKKKNKMTSQVIFHSIDVITHLEVTQSAEILIFKKTILK